MVPLHIRPWQALFCPSDVSILPAYVGGWTINDVAVERSIFPKPVSSLRMDCVSHTHLVQQMDSPS